MVVELELLYLRGKKTPVPAHSLLTAVEPDPLRKTALIDGLTLLCI